MEEKASREPYPTDVDDAEWAFAVPYLTLMRPGAPKRVYALREVFNAVRWLVRTGAQCGCCSTSSLPERRSTSRPSAGGPAASSKRWSTTCACCCAGARARPRARPRRSSIVARCRARRRAEREPTATEPSGRRAQSFTPPSIRWATCSRCTSRRPMHRTARRWPSWLRRWVVERSFTSASRFRRLARDCERLTETVAGLHFLAFACLMVQQLVSLISQSP